MEPLRIHKMVPVSEVNGPGKRAVIWFQGCSLGCAGCWNPETWDAESAGHETPMWAVLEWLKGTLKENPELEGITFSGGEPMQQPTWLYLLIVAIRRQYPHLSIGLFSGYADSELTRRMWWEAIRKRIDFAVLGRYNAQQPAHDPLVTSRNQALRLYSDRYTAADFQPQAIEVTIDGNGLTQLTGFPTKGGI